MNYFKILELWVSCIELLITVTRLRLHKWTLTVFGSSCGLTRSENIVIAHPFLPPFVWSHISIYCYNNVAVSVVSKGVTKLTVWVSLIKVIQLKYDFEVISVFGILIFFLACFDPYSISIYGIPVFLCKIQQE